MTKGVLGMTRAALGMTKGVLGMTRAALGMIEGALGMTNWVLLEFLNLRKPVLSGVEGIRVIRDSLRVDSRLMTSENPCRPLP